jgi:hypothetical protein
LPLKVLSHRVLGGGQAEVKQSEAGLELFVPESDRQPIVTIIALEMEGDVMQLPAIAVSLRADAGILKNPAATGADKDAKK